MIDLIQIAPNKFKHSDGLAILSLSSGNGPTLYERILMRSAPSIYAEKMAAAMEKASGCKVIRMVREVK